MRLCAAFSYLDGWAVIQLAPLRSSASCASDVVVKNMFFMAEMLLAGKDSPKSMKSEFCVTPCWRGESVFPLHQTCPFKT